MSADDRLAEIRARAGVARQAAASGTTGLPPNIDGLSISEALDIFAESAEDVPWLLAEIRRLRADLTEQTERADHEDRCAVLGHRNASFWQAEYERLRRVLSRLDESHARQAAALARVRELVADTGNTSTGPTYALCADVLAAIEGTDR